MKTSILKTLSKYGKLEQMTERNTTPNIIYWRLDIFKEFAKKNNALCRDFNKRFDTYTFSSCQTTINNETKTFIYIYKKAL